MGAAMLILLAQIENEIQMAEDRHFQEQIAKATLEERTILFAAREKLRLERIAERRHREQIRAQEKIADAIRFNAIMR